MPYAIFLKCFILYKGNIEDYLKKCWFIAESKHIILEETFGKQENTTKLGFFVVAVFLYQDFLSKTVMTHKAAGEWRRPSFNPI